MGEIKSTLDLVMEKTKNLTLSSEEKQKQEEAEIQKRIRGMLQKYQDGLLAKKQLINDYEKLVKEYNLSDNTILINEIFGRIDPDQDSRPLLELLREGCDINSANIESLIQEYRAAYHEAAQIRMNVLKENLAQKHLISGSAVVPNLEADEQWHREARRMRAGFEDRLSRKKAEILQSASER